MLRAGVSPQELKDLMFGHGRKGARGHYDYDELTIKEAYAKVFEHLSINGLQVRTDLKKVMDGLKGLNDVQTVFQRQLEAKDKELEEVKTELKALSSMIKQVASSEQAKLADGVHKEVANKLLADKDFMEKFKKDAQKIKSSTLKADKK